jgi:hypothetical protein
MLRINSKNQTRQRVHDRIRKKVIGTPERPRLNVYRSLNHIYVQLIDDLKGVTLAAASTADDRAATWRRRRWWGKRSPIWPKKRATPKWFSIAGATFTTGGSRPWPMRRAKRDCSSRNSSQFSVFGSQ